MKKAAIIILLLSAAMMLQAQTTWHVETTGDDVNGTGTAANPWRTIYKATSTVPAVDGDYGDVIQVGSGTFYISTIVNIDGVSLQGSGYNTHAIVQRTDDNHAINVTNTTGQIIHISGIRFDGNSTSARRAIQVYNTNNVYIHDNFFENFLRSAAVFGGTTYRTGNRFYNNTVTNCAGGVTSGYADESYALEINRQTDFIVDNCVMNEKVRGVTTSGIPLGGLNGTKGLIIRNTEIRANYRQGSNWVFGIELWYNEGISITDSDIEGEIDLGGFGVFPGGYTNGLTFAGNILGPTAPIGRSAVGLQIEQFCEKVVIERNIFRNLEQPIYFCLAWPSDKVNYADDITIKSNLMYGVTGYDGGFGIRFESGSNDYLGGSACLPPTYVDNIKIYNNTLVSNSTTRADYGILLPSQGRSSGVTNIDVRNNIVAGFSSYAIYAYRQDNDYTQSISTINVTYNNYYGNGSNSAYFNGFTPTSYTSGTGIITTNPNFVSSTDFHLQSGSGAIRTGAYISTVITDLGGLNYLNPASMGAYEYTASAALATVTTTAISGITTTEAYSGGYISSDGGAAVTARGVCWGVSINPTTANDITSDGNGTGSFTSLIEALTPGETYHVRAYATNSEGTAYGQDRQFTAGEEIEPETGRILWKRNGRLMKYNDHLLLIPVIP